MLKNNHNPNRRWRLASDWHVSSQSGLDFWVLMRVNWNRFLIERIISLDVFGCTLTTKDKHLQATRKSQNKYQSCGVWHIASRINHSYVATFAAASSAGDLQIIRATRDIPPDTELMFWYRNPSGDYSEMQNGLEQWNFWCKCVICLDSRNTPKRFWLGDTICLESWRRLWTRHISTPPRLNSCWFHR